LADSHAKMQRWSRRLPFFPLNAMIVLFPPGLFWVDGKCISTRLCVVDSDRVQCADSDADVAGSEFQIARDQLNIRRAVESDRRAVRMLLPQIREPASCFVAVAGDRPAVIGAAAATASNRTTPAIGPGVAVEVIEPCRQRGIARALLERLESDVAQLTGATALFAAQRVERGSESAAAWAGLGFSSIESVEEHQLPTAGFEESLGTLIERMHAKGKIPTTACIVPLYRANAAAVLQLHIDQLGGDRGELYRKILGKGVGAFHPRYSKVLLVVGQVKGCILAHRISAELAQVDANIVHPSVRGGWANVWLKLEATRGALKLGIKTFQFTTFDHYTDTRSFTERLGGHTQRVTQLFYRPIERRN
jgi:N-acetylglutamate synthase-like GNAT family acetyltransferase